MNQIKSIAISCLLCVLAVAAAVGVLLVINKKNTMSVSAPAVSCDQLELSVEFPAGERRIRIWKDQEGVYYFFLPSGVENCRIDFCNLGDDSTLRLDSDIYTSDNSVIYSLEYSKLYDMELNISQEEQLVERGQVIFLKSERLPSLFIDTASGNMEAVHSDKEIKEEASIWLIDAEGNREYSGGIEYIKCRGNFTFEAEKKPYQIKLLKNASLLGMPSAEKWILLANVYDDTLIKNELVFRFAERYSSVPSIRGEFVDLYLNSEYVGNYYFCEKVEVGENRLNITDLKEKTKQVNFPRSYESAVLYVSDDGKIKATSGLQNPEDITGGYLLEHLQQRDYETAENAFMTDSGCCYAIISPNPATVEQAQYICNFFNEMELAMIQEDGIHPVTGKHFSEYLDIDSWTSKYLIEEVFHDTDAPARSMFFYKDSDSVDSHVFSGPMWDYDVVLGGLGSSWFFWYSPFQIGDLGIYVQELMHYQDVREQVYNKFEQYVLPYVEYQASADIYNLSRRIQVSAEMNRVRWPDEYGYYSDDRAERDWLISFLEQKADFLRQNWLEDEDYCTVTFLDYYGEAYEKYKVKRGEYLDAAPEISVYAEIFNGWYTVDGGILFDSRLPILRDVTYESRWIPVSIILENGLAISGMDVTQVDAEALQSMVDQIRLLQEEAATAEAGNDIEEDAADG